MASRVEIGNYESLDFNSPMTNETADRLVAELAATNPSAIADVGCGWGELLLRLAAACPEADAVGVDNDETLLERARGNAAGRSLQNRVTFQTDLGSLEPSDVVVCIGAEHVFGSVGDALSGLQGLVRPGGRLLFGTLFWEQTPTPELATEFAGVAQLIELFHATSNAGWRALALKTASLDDWDRFEFGFMRDWEQVVMATRTKAEAADASLAADDYRTSYLQRRGILGFAFLTLGRPMFAATNN